MPSLPVQISHTDVVSKIKTGPNDREKRSHFPQNKNLPIENTTDVLSTMASVCKVMLETP